MELIVVGVVIAFLLLVAVLDRLQAKHTIKRNFPIIGRFRYWFEALGGPLRQYIVTGNDEERPFSRDQRRWVYASAKRENNYFGFGTDNDLEQTPGYLIVRHAAFPVSSPRMRSISHSSELLSRLPGTTVRGRSVLGSSSSSGMARASLR